MQTTFLWTLQLMESSLLHGISLAISESQQVMVDAVESCDRLCGLVATDPEVRVRFPALTDFLRSSWFGTRSTQPREYK
jgi:hypothetical protein